MLGIVVLAVMFGIFVAANLYAKPLGRGRRRRSSWSDPWLDGDGTPGIYVVDDLTGHHHHHHHAAAADVGDHGHHGFADHADFSGHHH